MRRLTLTLLAALFFAPGSASAQSSPGWSRGYVPSAGEIGNAFAKKQDKLQYTPLSQSGGTMTGKLQAAPSTINGAGFAILPGIAPTTPSNGDLWATSVGLYGQFGGRTLAIPGLDQSTGALLVLGGPTIGTYQSGKYTSQPYAIQIQGSGSTGDVSGMSVLPSLGNTTRALKNKFLDGGVSVLDFSSTVGTGGDDSAAINAALQSACAYTTTNPAAKTCKVIFPEPPSGAYNVCANPVTLPGYWSSVMLQGTGAAPKIRVLPGCTSGIQAVVYQALNTGDSSAARLHIDNLTLDSYCIAPYSLYIGYAVGTQVTRSIFRNAKAGAGNANIYIGGGYEINIDKSNRAENVNEPNHTCYNTNADLPDYNLYTKSSDSWYGLAAVDAKVANYYNANGGNNHFSDAHGWGFTGAFAPYASSNLAPQYTLLAVGNVDATNIVMDSPQVAGIYLKSGLDGNGVATGVSNALVTASHIFGQAAGASAVLLDPGLKSAVIAANDFTYMATAVATVSGAIDPSIVIANNGDTSPAAPPWTAYTPTITCGAGTPTAASATGRYERTGKRVTVTLNVTITTNGTCAGSIALSLPFASGPQASAINGSERSATGKALEGIVNAGASSLSVWNYDNTYPGASGGFLVLSGVYEAQ